MTKRKKTILWSILALILAILLGILVFLWPLLSSAFSVKKLEEGLYTMDYTSDYAFDDFLKQGGASSDLAVADFVVKRLFRGLISFDVEETAFGCSTLSVPSVTGESLFGRNFDWGFCNTMIVETKPKNGFSSISTVNMDVLNVGLALPEDSLVRLMSAAAAYAPMDGMNEAGLVAAVLMINDSHAFSQDTGKPDLTTTTAIRLLLDKAATVEEALQLLRDHDLHASANLMVHFAIADTTGRSVVVEYIDNQMVVTDSDIVTNFYLAKSEKYGLGAEESHLRYDILAKKLAETPTMTMEQVRDALDSVSKRNFDSQFASTEWSTVYNQATGEILYYHRENYTKAYPYTLD